jgi:chemotaxis protein histidine kinase CheA
MDAMIQSYMEETEEMLQRAEECLIQLEMEYSSASVNELFRIAHTIKGSSHMVGYEDIGNLMHKIEDMLDCARNETIPFDEKIASLCFDGLDTVKKMLQFKKENGSSEMEEPFAKTALRISEAVDDFIQAGKKRKRKLSPLQR